MKFDREPKDPFIRRHVQVITDALAAGNSRTTACKLARIHRKTFYTWLQKDENFALAVEYAEATGESENISVIRAADDWRARAWLLERTNRADWGRRDDVTINLRDIRNLTDEQLRELEARIAEREGAAEPDSEDELRELPE